MFLNDFCSELLQTFDVEVDGAGSDGTSAGQGDAGGTPGTLSLGSLTVATGSIYDFEFANSSGNPASNDQIAVTSNLVGTLHVPWLDDGTRSVPATRRMSDQFGRPGPVVRSILNLPVQLE